MAQNQGNQGQRGQGQRGQQQGKGLDKVHTLTNAEGETKEVTQRDFMANREQYQSEGWQRDDADDASEGEDQEEQEGDEYEADEGETEDRE
jgi:hypothetical protein